MYHMTSIVQQLMCVMMRQYQLKINFLISFNNWLHLFNSSFKLLNDAHIVRTHCDYMYKVYYYTAHTHA